MHPEKLDFEELGFMCGLEIHQQLLTSKKLFCRCPVVYKKDEGDMTILRHMRPTLSEMGTYDGTALMEFKTKKDVIYHVYSDTVCTYEMDDTPPFPINQEALDAGLEITMLLGCKLVDELHISRKQYLDGSIPTGFQRTGILGVDGCVPFDGELRIRQISIEEDSCREMWDRGHTISFKTDRLGTPLIEVVTEPDIKHPKNVARAASFLGRAMRATGRVRRGLGATRQDVNVSIRGGTRVEIKGVAKLQWMESLTATEALRQKALLDIRDELLSRGIEPSSIYCRKDIVTDIVSGTQWEPLASSLEDGEAGCVLLRGFRDLLYRETQPGLPFLHEFSGRVRVIACLDGSPNIMGGEEIHQCLPEDVVLALEDHMGMEDGDDMILVWGPERDVKTALDEIEERAREACVGVPNETRQPFENGTTGFERILPGPDRMYPDTDHPPLALEASRMEELGKNVDEASWEKEERYIGMGLPCFAARALSYSPSAGTFESVVKRGVPPLRAARALLEELPSSYVISIPEEDLIQQLLVLSQPVPVWAWRKWAIDGNGPPPPLASEEDVLEEAKRVVFSGLHRIDRAVGAVLLSFGGWASVPMVMDAVESCMGDVCG